MHKEIVVAMSYDRTFPTDSADSSTWGTYLFHILGWLVYFIAGNLFSFINIAVIGFCSLVSHSFRILVLAFNTIQSLMNVVHGIVTLNFNLISTILHHGKCLKEAIISSFSYILETIGSILHSVVDSLLHLPWSILSSVTSTTQHIGQLLSGVMKNIEDLLLVCFEELDGLKASVILSLWTVTEVFMKCLRNIVSECGLIFISIIETILIPFKAGFLFLSNAAINTTMWASESCNRMLKCLSIENILFVYVYITDLLRKGLLLPLWELLVHLLSLPYTTLIYCYKIISTTSIETYINWLLLNFLILVMVAVVYVILSGRLHHLVKLFLSKLLKPEDNRLYVRAEEDVSCRPMLQEELITCVICQDQPKRVLLMPCKHLCLCKTCLIQLKSLRFNRRVCPICRTFIRNTIEVFI